ncbi:MAG: ThuA domain-containing protein [Parvibaculales bacterium]
MSDEQHPKRINCVLIASGKYHDIDFARLELLKLFGEDMRFRVRVFENYENLDAIREADCLVTYTCDVMPSIEAQEVLKDWLNEGGRWFALHGTNSILRMLDDGSWAAPRWAPLFMEMLGSQFISHPPIEPYLVTNAQPDHELVKGIEPFETTDELYHLECHGELDVLLETDCTKEGTGFAEAKDAIGKQPVFYIKTHGKGAVLYLTLGHCRGHYDMQPVLDWWPTVERCAWDLPIFYTLLRRGMSWIRNEKPTN